MKVTEDIKYIGVNDHQVDLFEGQFEVPLGMAYNSYVIKDAKIAVMDTVDQHFGDEWLKNLKAEIGDAAVDYLVVQHMEPDHSANIAAFAAAYPTAKIVASLPAFAMMKNYFGTDYAERRVVIKEGDTLDLGTHKLAFVAAPMVHWPEVMVSYDETDGTLFSADAFGTFGALGGDLYADEDETDWGEMRRYYANIVGKYGAQVQNLLKKAAGLDIRMICPLHGPIWRKDFGALIEKYGLWSRWEGEGGLVIFCASIYGGTQNAADRLASMLSEKGVKRVKVYDVSALDQSFLVAEAFRCRAAVMAASSYNAGVFVKMEEFLRDLKAHDYKNHLVAFVENGSWAPLAAKEMKAILEGQALETVGDTVTLRSAPHEKDAAALEALADALCAAMKA